VAGATTAFSGSASAAVKVSATAKASAFHLAGDTKGVTITSETDYPDGTALVSYSKNGEPYEASGPDGSIITFTPAKADSPSSNADIMALTMPSTVKAGGIKVRKLGSFGPASHGAASTAFAQRHGVSVPIASPNGLGDACVTPSGAGGYFCDYIQLVSDNGGGDWYVGDTLSASGTKILFIKGQISRTAPNQLVQWNPTNVSHPSSCTSQNFGVSVNGASISTSTQVCPDAFGPPVSPTISTYVMEWAKNCCTGANGGFAAVDIYHNPPGAPWGVNEAASSLAGN